ncbi:MULTISPECIES: translocation/assembly module TamB domain-containing protein [unclassified Pseudomonas]|uniref:translocation/assembly module TamB domain-containing protein n=1 Tax=unclassified Pseudomonas TaxID=196821 RepID=UPI000BD09583|nr:MULTISPECIES: translocation/assembly module TamB domain-containing protein [unclassified Pseudomonas]PVZ20283.1 translocation and assembly module TamB [Pseudomonas sp. URIL14HWK12:I12]PVZ27349.1 translocation and assembly module TamB [Pseudomonas sp. URIL14HWK12:I10]PVZ38238.1 translocation and assembly module TamB [Pseudomonas sp. URIL14HWK12:I11]SNZ04147.1 translocation and assembly module TamB [Pseudomonas sp. URIL14HWK12:I9]
MKRAVRWAGGALLGLVVVLLVALWAVLGTASGGRWALSRVPGLAVDGATGALVGQWHAQRLRWQAGAQWVEAQDVALQWSPRCLARLALCIDSLEVGRLAMDFPAQGDKPADAPSPLPDLQLPLAIDLKSLRVASLAYAGSVQATDLSLSANWTNGGIELRTFQARREALQVILAGHLQPEGDWPLVAATRLQLPDVDGKPWWLSLQVRGPLAGEVALQGRSEGYLQAMLAGRLQPLAEHVPASLAIDAERFEPSSNLPATLAFDQLHMAAEGDLAQGYKVDGKATLPAAEGPITLRLEGAAEASGARIAGLSLEAGPEQRVALTGEVDWSTGLQAQASLDWRAFPWARLYPQTQPPPVSVERLKAEVSYRDGHYLGNLDGAFKGPAGPFTVVTPFSGDLQALYLPQLVVKAGQGEASGSVKLDFAEGVGWDVAMEFARLNPAYWVAELPGRLAGPLRSQGQWRDGELKLSADMAIAGQLRGQPARLSVKGQGQGQQWSVPLLDVQLGANRIQGQAALNERLAGKLDLTLPRLGQLWPGLRGQAQGSLVVAGTASAPVGQLKLQGQQLGYGGQAAERLDLQASLDARQRASVSLTATGLRDGDTALGVLAIQGQGTAEQHQLTVKLDGPQLSAALSADGRWNQGVWKGRLASGQLRGGDQRWQLEAPAPLQRLASGEIDLGAHCWRSGRASLCGENQRPAPEPRIRYQLQHFALEGLAPLLPQGLAWEGELNATVALDLPAKGPSGHIDVDASGGTLRLRDGQQWRSFPYQALRLQSRLAPRQVDGQVSFEGGPLGELQARVTIDPLSQAKALSGSFTLQGLNIAVAQAFLPQAQSLAGTVSGEGRLAGTLAAPQVMGQLRLAGGKVAGPQLPLALDQLAVSMDLNGDQARLQGSWRSGESGSGHLEGTLGWAPALAMDLRLNGTRLPLTIEPYARVEASPDLRATFDGQRLAVSGLVQVPRGAITVRQLPPSTVKVSDDTVIIGQEAGKRSAPMAIAMDVNVEVGRDKLTFEGFGLQANLAGHVHIGDNLDTRGELVLNDGRYRAYGQRLALRRARVFFAGPIDQPYLDVEAIRQADNVIAGIRLSGSVEQPVSEVFSEPAMSQEQALSYLLLGRPLSTSGEDNNMLAQAALGLGLMGTSGKAGELASSLGVQDFQLDTEGSGNKTNVVASGNLSEKLTLRYGVGVFEPASTIALRYALTRRLYIEVASGLASSLDLFYKRDF